MDRLTTRDGGGGDVRRVDEVLRRLDSTPVMDGYNRALHTLSQYIKGDGVGWALVDAYEGAVLARLEAAICEALREAGPNDEVPAADEPLVPQFFGGRQHSPGERVFDEALARIEPSTRRTVKSMLDGPISDRLREAYELGMARGIEGKL